MSEGWNNLNKDFDRLQMNSDQNEWGAAPSQNSNNRWNNRGGYGHGQPFSQNRGGYQSPSFRDGRNYTKESNHGWRERGRGRGKGRGGSYKNNHRSYDNDYYSNSSSSSSSHSNNHHWQKKNTWSSNEPAQMNQPTRSDHWGHSQNQQENDHASTGWGSASPTSHKDRWNSHPLKGRGEVTEKTTEGWDSTTTTSLNKSQHAEQHDTWRHEASKRSHDPWHEEKEDKSNGWDGVVESTTPIQTDRPWAVTTASSTDTTRNDHWNTVASSSSSSKADTWHTATAESIGSSHDSSSGWDATPKSSTPNWGSVTLDSLGWSEKSKKNVKEAGRGEWRDGTHILAEENEELKLKLFGTSEDHDTMHTGINFDKYKDIPVEVKGENVPHGIVEFATSGLDRHLLDNIAYAHYKTPTPVQKHSIPIVMQGHDLMACAQTGSGKTAAFLFPLLSALFSKGPLADPQEPPVKRGYHSYQKAYPQALILAPTRELVSQIYKEAKKYCYRSYVRPCVAYGGADIQQQLRLIDRGCHLLVATPGRLVDILERGRLSFQNIQYLVLDEADRMLDMGFEPQVRRIVEGEDMPPCEKRQTLMFSATFPDKIQSLARDFLKAYVFLSVGRVGGATENITQKVELLKDEEKQDRLLQLLAESQDATITTPTAAESGGGGGGAGLTLIFTETKRMADVVCEWLVDNGWAATAIHGDRVQSEREAALDSFRRGTTPIMVATAVAARGLDIPNVTHVISYDLPKDVDDYVHRIGRTGRAGNTGVATAFFTYSNRFMAGPLVKVLQDAKQTVPAWLEEMRMEVATSPSTSSSPSSRGGRRREGGGASDGNRRRVEERGGRRW